MSTIQTRVCEKLVVVVEIAGSKWVVASYAGVPGRMRRKNLSEAGVRERFEALLMEIESAREKFGLGKEASVVVGYEAGQEGFWLSRALRSRGVEAVVIDAVSLQVDRRHKRAKTDRLDAEGLVVALWRRMVEGDERVLRLVREPDEAAEDSREWQRERDRLQSERRGCWDRIVKKLRTQGIWEVPEDLRERLRAGTLRNFSGSPLGTMLQRTLCMELARVELAEAKLKELARQTEALSPPARAQAERLQQLRGIGPCGARALALLLYWREFANRRQVGACVGLVGVPFDSGTLRQDQGISRQGDPKLRALLVELAWMWLRYQPDSALSRWFQARTQGASKRGKRVMIVAVARRLAIALWRYLKQGVVPEGARFKTVAA